MAIDRSALFKSIKALWPSNMALDGGLWRRVEIYDALEELLPADDNWRQLALWAFNQAVEEAMDLARSNGAPALSLDAVTFSDFERWMLDNLEDESWDKERAEWQAAMAAGALH